MKSLKATEIKEINMSVIIENENDYSFDFDYEDVIKSVIKEALNYVKCPYDCEVNVLITSPLEVQSINKEYRGIDKTTDVLSFPMLEYNEPANFDVVLGNEEDCVDPDTGELNLGDIVLNYEKIFSQATEYGHSQKRELAFLVAHSMFHLFGYDHETDEERVVMEEKQEEVLAKLGITRDE